MVQLWIAVLLTLVTAVARLFYPTRGLETFGWPGTYEALSHMVVGGLLGAWLVTWKHFYLYLFLALTAVEVLASIFWK